MNLIKKLNELSDKLAEKLSDALSSMSMFWIITLMVVIPLIWVQPKDAVSWMQYIVSVFFQGVALPVLGYTAKLSGIKNEKLAELIKELSLKIESQTEHIEKEVDEIIVDIEKDLNE